ncbi:SKP1/BTB/POZ domain, NPH3 domain protein [Artemisia annua]|uniref:SKP1/BTB/POZ domain, NPH3 domain protein n=1 Tax=Artemisia annua TaxID=35608 RepID=A0A2U1QEZ3_ARTAN|nr:SKP1/BTB/POZ domain, NPH3 domain protein [Artemisia annua]
MKFMKLGSKPDTFYTSNGARSIKSEIRSDFVIQVNETRYLLHKFPLLSKCLKLQRLCSKSHETSQIIQLPDFPGGSEAFELCAKFCYEITITLSAYNIVSARCAAKYLEMTEDVEKGNLVHKLEVFFNSYILNGFKDCIVMLQTTLQMTKPFQLWSEELGITSRCIESLVSKVVSDPLKVTLSHNHPNRTGDIEEVYTMKKWWGDDLSELRIDLYWRTMAALKSCRKVPQNLIGDSLEIYMSKWLPKISSNIENGSGLNGEMEHSSSNSRLILETIITVLPIERNAVSCTFLLKLLKLATIFGASASTRLELTRRVAIQLDEAKVCDLMIPSMSNECDTVYNIDIFLSILEQFWLQSQHQQTSPRKTLQLAENGDSESCSSSLVLNSSMLKVTKLVDGYLQEIARDVNVPLSKFIALVEAVPGHARVNHDDLYQAIDIYLKSHPDSNKSERKNLCRTLDFKKLSQEASMHAAQNEFLPLRVLLQALFFEQTRAAMSDVHLTEVPSHNEASFLPDSLSTNTSTPQQSRNPSVSKPRTRVAADDDSKDGSLNVKQSCFISTKPQKMMFSKCSLMNCSKMEK